VIDMRTGEVKIVGTHDGGGAVAGIAYDGARGGTKMLYTCGWDRKIIAWDCARESGEGRRVATVETPGKCYASDLSVDGVLVVAMSDRQVLAYACKDILAGGRPKVHRQSSMRFQTRAVKVSPTDPGALVLSSVEGRVALEYMDTERNDTQRYAFKCHRKTEDASTGEIVYPVHAVAFHPLGTFATGGGDGVVNIWDGAAKKRLFQCPRYPTSISSLEFSPCGTMLAIASSYAHEERDIQHDAKPLDRLYLRYTHPDEVRPKALTTTTVPK